jgi:hypothetical protein
VGVVGFTGHQNLIGVTRRQVAHAIVEQLVNVRGEEFTGVTSLAAGADQIFGFCVLAAGGRLEAVIPADGYRDTMQNIDQVHFDLLLALSTTVEHLPFREPTNEAYLSAGERVVNKCDLLLAVWDGRPAAGLGGTADVVAYARHHGTEVHVIWPLGAQRD